MKYFTLNEFLRSETAKARKIDNTPTEAITIHLHFLVDTLLDPLREQWTKYCEKHNLGTGALKVNSGYRCKKLNIAVGGVSTSAHMYGYAADINPCNKKQTEFEKFVVDEFIKFGVKFDQIIIERNKTSRWVHFGVKNYNGLQRMQNFRLKV